MAQFTLVQTMKNPGGRTQYRIAGHKGNMCVFDNLFEGGVAPATITVDCPMVDPIAKVDKSAEAATKAAAKVEAAAAKVIANAEKARLRQEKADAALAKAKAKVDAANAAKAAAPAEAQS